jgi:putative flippase GtrA
MEILHVAKSSGHIQFIRYVIVGITQNLLGYALYLFITWAGIDPKTAITLLYPVGFMLSYMGNKKWSFSHEGKHSQAFIRFAITHIFGYAFNIAGLYVFVDMYGYNHRYIQLLLMFILMFYFFFALRLFVFTHSRPK